MFCEKCGNQIPNGSVCPCQQSNRQYQATHPAKVRFDPSSILTVPVQKFFALGLAVISAIFLLVDGWWGVREGYFRFSALGCAGEPSVFDASAVLGVGSIFAYLTLVLFFVYFVSEFINWNKLAINKILGIVYYGLYTFVLLLTFIGSLSADDVGPSWAMIFVFFIAGGGLALSIVQLVTKK